LGCGEGLRVEAVVEADEWESEEEEEDDDDDEEGCKGTEISTRWELGLTLALVKLTLAEAGTASLCSTTWPSRSRVAMILTHCSDGTPTTLTVWTSNPGI